MGHTVEELAAIRDAIQGHGVKDISVISGMRGPIVTIQRDKDGVVYRTAQFLDDGASEEELQGAATYFKGWLETNSFDE